MYDLGTIKRMNREAAEKAAAEKKAPLILTQGDVDFFRKTLTLPSGARFPHLGDYRPRGYRLVRTLFCDASGFGSSSEPALTIEQLSKEVKPEYGYATIEAGQFQVKLGEFKVTTRREK